MIAFVKGPVYDIDFTESRLTIEFSGLGLSVLAPLNRLHPLPVLGEEIMLHTHLQIREDAWQLFGFPLIEQLTVFRQLLAISGIGAKTALAVIDTLDLPQLRRVMATSDVKALCAVPGIGKKTAERLILELKDKYALLERAEASPAATMPLGGEVDNDLLFALHQLGYTPTEARRLEMLVGQQAPPAADTTAKLRLALKLGMKA